MIIIIIIIIYDTFGKRISAMISLQVLDHPSHQNLRI